MEAESVAGKRLEILLHPMEATLHPPIAPLPRGSSLRADAVSTLVKAVLQGRLKQGDRLIVRKLAEQLRVSATPVREAIVELESLGIIDVNLNASAVIRRFGAKELREIYHVRAVLEVEATRMAIDRIPRELLQQLLDEGARLMGGSGGQWGATARQHDMRLHRSIAEHSGSARLAHEIGRYSRLMQCISEVVGNEHNWLQQAVVEHVQIIDALLARDAEKAPRLMDQHIHRSSERDINVLCELSPEANDVSEHGQLKTGKKG